MGVVGPRPCGEQVANNGHCFRISAEQVANNGHCFIIERAISESLERERKRTQNRRIRKSLFPCNFSAKNAKNGLKLTRNCRNSRFSTKIGGHTPQKDNLSKSDYTQMERADWLISVTGCDSCNSIGLERILGTFLIITQILKIVSMKRTTDQQDYLNNQIA